MTINFNELNSQIAANLTAIGLNVLPRPEYFARAANIVVPSVGFFLSGGSVDDFELNQQLTIAINEQSYSNLLASLEAVLIKFRKLKFVNLETSLTNRLEYEILDNDSFWRANVRVVIPVRIANATQRSLEAA